MSREIKPKREVLEKGRTLTLSANCPGPRCCSVSSPLLSRPVPTSPTYALHTAILSGECLTANSPVQPSGEPPALILLSCGLPRQGVERINWHLFRA